MRFPKANQILALLLVARVGNRAHKVYFAFVQGSNSAPIRLQCLRGIASDVVVAETKFSKLETRCWAAFAFGALRSMCRGYIVVVCVLHAMKPTDAEDKLKRQELLHLITDQSKQQTNHANRGKTPLGVTRPMQPLIKTPHCCFMSFCDWLSC